MARFYRLCRYVMVGAGVFVAQFLTLILLVEHELLSPLWASVVAFVEALLLSFFLQRKVTFQKVDATRMGREFMLTGLLSICNFIFNIISMYLLLAAGVHYLLAQVVVTGFIIAYTYLVYHVIFKV